MDDILTQVNVLTSYSLISCCSCKAVFAVPQSSKNHLTESHNTFWCPFCGTGQSFRKESEADKLRRALKWAEEYKEEYRKERDSLKLTLRTTKGHITRIKNRVGNGVCPCCNRTFRNLQRHINSKHPDFIKEESQ